MVFPSKGRHLASTGQGAGGSTLSRRSFPAGLVLLSFVGLPLSHCVARIPPSTPTQTPLNVSMMLGCYA